MNKLVYISGKITGLERSEAAAIFNDAEQIIKLGGNTPANPMIMIKQRDDFTWEHHMKEAIQLMLACDAIIMLPNWPQSRGAKIEHSIAKTLRIPISYLNYTPHEEEK
jgi:hypothetical protein